MSFKKNITLSKSDFLLYMKHPAWLWLKKYQPEMLPGVDQSLQAIFDNGTLFESYVENTYPNSVKIGFSRNGLSYKSMPERTARAINAGARTVLQGRAEANGLTCIFDVLEHISGNNYALTEIKSSTKVKDEHILDLGFQKIVLEKSGIKIAHAKVRYVDPTYIRKKDLDIDRLSITEDVTELVNQKIEYIKLKVEGAKDIVASSQRPSLSPRFVADEYIKDWLIIYENLQPPESEYNIYKLTRLKPDLIGKLEDLKVSLIENIPLNIQLSDKQKKQFSATKQNSVEINTEKIENFLQDLKFPLYFFDYETFSEVVPTLEGTRPYEQIPFQYSLHILDKGGHLTHCEFLHEDPTDPRLDLLKNLSLHVGREGSVITWNKSFEMSVNKNLADFFPDFKDFLIDLNLRVVDLMEPFIRDWYIHKDFYGSASIKNVLPVLISELSYENLAIKEGATASRMWTDIVFREKDYSSKKDVLKNLKKYCETDTLAMVQIYKHLCSI